ncbi:Fibronectin type III domain-containing protein [Salinimicrobium sediminis]|uniref:Fibronectin type III domain-containing protein n=1 Tax=Salinimicrobium sediminis TaxID=1343891 RepID=A0A285X3F8_9FLAO|nr:fibronectin type III domain-containing protein [Salinimicrobium sediminis]SOC79818.1 Fibronectin type III domain-containing protein [Salinimicrobium sediminis]
MIATIQNISSSKFSLNGLEYNKSFIALKVGDNYIRIVSVYDTRLELVATTHFNQVQVGGTVHTSANNLINALTDVLFSKAESSGGGLEPGGDFTGTLNVGTGSTTKYNDYLTGSAVSLALSASKVAGSYATVRIKGSLTGSWPSTWKVSGDAKSSSADIFNELSIAYLADDDIRGVNRVYSISGAPTGDTTAPSVPTGLTSTSKTDTSVNLSWNASTDAVGVTGYAVYKNGVYEKEVGGTTAQITGLTASTAYSFTVAAIDAAGNESAQSTALSVSTNAAASAQATFTLDDFTGAVLGYSLNKLRSAYTGSAIRVRRSSDNTEQDIGFNADNRLDQTALLNFVGAGDGFISVWYDQSTSARNVSNPEASQPKIVNAGTIYVLNGKPTVYFNQKYLRSEIGQLVNNVDGSWSSFGFGQFNAQGNNYMFSQDASQRVSQNLKVSVGANSGETIAFQTDGTVITDTSPVSASYIGSPVQITAINTGTSVESFMNGNGNGSVSISGSKVASDRWEIGGRGNGITPTDTNAYISEVIHYAENKTTDKAGIESAITANHS